MGQLSLGIPPLPLRLALQASCHPPPPTSTWVPGDPNSQSSHLHGKLFNHGVVFSAHASFFFLFIILIVHICGVEYVMASEDSNLLSILCFESRPQAIAQAGQDLTAILSQLLLNAGITGVRRHTWQHISKASVIQSLQVSSCFSGWRGDRN